MNVSHQNRIQLAAIMIHGGQGSVNFSS